MSISDRELALIREQQELFMPSLALIERRQFDGDDDFAYVPVSADTPCRLTPGLGHWSAVAERWQGITPFTMTTAWNADLLAGDRVWDVYGRQFEVRDVRASGSLATARKALLDMVTDG